MKTTIGIEVHAELRTKSKMFCGCENNPHASEANTHVCPVCMAHPGTLPTVNKQAVHFLMQIGRAIGGTLANYSEFDRKNYFYPDIPKAYQISQYQFPFVTGGVIAGVAITRVHLEEDTARSQHEDGQSFIDFNRAGVPLMELVTEPVIHSAKEAVDFARELQLLLRTLGVSDANMEKGEMRVEANISISDSDELGTKVEVKNLNSFKAVEGAIIYEERRQAVEAVIQETRGWDEEKGKTFSQRVKESADDYRYFPDPDIPKFDRTKIPEFSDSRIDEILPNTPTMKREEYRDIGLSDGQIEIIISDMKRDNFFRKTLETLSKAADAKMAANYFISDVLGVVDARGKDLDQMHPDTFAGLIDLVSSGSINSRVAKDILEEVVFDGLEASKIAQERGLMQQNDTEHLLLLIKQIIAENESVAAEYKAGKEASLQFLIGQTMKATKGAANPVLLKELLEKELLK